MSYGQIESVLRSAESILRAKIGAKIDAINAAVYAEMDSGEAETYDVDGLTFVLHYNGGDAQTVTLTGDGRTAAQVITQINAGITSVTASAQSDLDNANRFKLKADAAGKASFTIGNGTANSVLGFVSGQTAHEEELATPRQDQIRLWNMSEQVPDQNIVRPPAIWLSSLDGETIGMDHRRQTGTIEFDLILYVSGMNFYTTRNLLMRLRQAIMEVFGDSVNLNGAAGFIGMSGPFVIEPYTVEIAGLDMRVGRMPIKILYSNNS